MKGLLPEGRHRYIMLALLFSGIVLVMIGTFSVFGKDPDEASSADDPYQEYEANLEKRIEELCVSVDGIDSAKALVTLDRTTEKIYAKNTHTVSNGDSSQTSGEYPASAICLGESYPTVRGVAVVVTGGERADVKQILTGMISSSLGIPTNRIAVAPAKQ